MAGLSFDEHDRSKSLVSAAFVARTRYIGDPYQPSSLRDFGDLAKQQPDQGAAQRVTSQ
jgi:hypothetical protein